MKDPNDPVVIRLRASADQVRAEVGDILANMKPDAAAALLVKCAKGDLLDIDPTTALLVGLMASLTMLEMSDLGEPPPQVAEGGD
jgi:hypothetical protein